MKKTLFSLVFLAFSLVSFAQTFTEQTFLEFCKKMEKDPVQILKSNATMGFVFVGTGGFKSDLKGLLALYDYNIPVSFTPTEFKIQNIGNTAIVTGRVKHSYTNKQTSASVNYDELITYVFVLVNKDWKFASAQHSEAPESEKPEEVVKQWIREYNKDDVGFFKDRCTEDFIASNFGGQFFGKKTLIENRKSSTQDTEVEVLKSYQSGNVGIATGILTYHHRQPDGSDNPDKLAFTFGMVKQNGKWMYATHQFATMNADDPKEVYKQWVTAHNKDPKAFLVDKCPDDLVGTVNGGAFYNNSRFKTMKDGLTADGEVSDMKSFQSGNLAVVSGILTRHNKQADGSDKPVKQMFTATMQKRNGKWWYVGHHATDAKE